MTSMMCLAISTIPTDRPWPIRLPACRWGFGNLTPPRLGWVVAPMPRGATGNVATEDVAYLLQGMGIDTGIDLDLLIDAGLFISEFLQRKPNSRAATALLNKRAG